MCFSATGSFALAGTLAGVGGVSVLRNTSAPHRAFALIPFIFAAQQASEGVVWLTVGAPSDALLRRLAVDAFLGLALVVWPVWLPFSLQRIEQSPARRRVLHVLLGVGAIVSVCAWFLLMRWQPVAVVAGHSIRYDHAGSNDSARDVLLLAAYIVPTIIPFFVSTLKHARTIGATLVLSLVVSALVERDALTSVWCFFAGILSIQIVVALDRARRAPAVVR